MLGNYRPQRLGPLPCREGVNRCAQKQQRAKIPNPIQIALRKFPPGAQEARAFEQKRDDCGEGKQSCLPTPKQKSHSQKKWRSVHVAPRAKPCNPAWIFPTSST